MISQKRILWLVFSARQDVNDGSWQSCHKFAGKLWMGVEFGAVGPHD